MLARLGSYMEVLEKNALPGLFRQLAEFILYGCRTEVLSSCCGLRVTISSQRPFFFFRVASSIFKLEVACGHPCLVHYWAPASQRYIQSRERLLSAASFPKLPKPLGHGSSLPVLQAASRAPCSGPLDQGEIYQWEPRLAHPDEDGHLFFLKP